MYPVGLFNHLSESVPLCCELLKVLQDPPTLALAHSCAASVTLWALKVHMTGLQLSQCWGVVIISVFSQCWG